MLLSAVSVLVVAQTSSEIPEGLMNNPVHQSFASSLTFTVTRIVGSIKVLVVGLLKKITKKSRKMLAEIGM